MSLEGSKKIPPPLGKGIEQLLRVADGQAPAAAGSPLRKEL
jgi:hypothetical protein